jgi:hypothetical protein
MAYQSNPNDPYRPPDDPFRSELQVDPQLAEGPASGGRIVMYAVAIVVVVGAVAYGMNSSTINHAGTSTAQNTTQTSPPAAPPGMRDVTPRTNTAPGVTTGAAPAQPVQPPAAAPTGPDINRAGNPPGSTTNPPASK